MTDALTLERPQYRSLQQAVVRKWSRTQRASRRMRRAWFAAAGLDDPRKQSPSHVAALHALNAIDRGRLFGRRDLDLSDLRAVDTAIAQFLQEFRGSDGGTLAGYAEGDGIAQSSVLLAHEIGVDRARRLLQDTDPHPAFTQAQQQRLLDESFARLSRGGRLRFEKRLDEIRAEMVQGFADGTNPLKIAAKLGADLDGYEQGRLRTIVRSEMGIASEGAIRDQFSADGVSRVGVLGDPNTDELCTSHIGQEFDLTDEENLPLYHPNCFCTVIAAAAGERAWKWTRGQIFLMIPDAAPILVADESRMLRSSRRAARCGCGVAYGAA